MNKADPLKSVETTLTIISIREADIIDVRFKRDDYEVDAQDRIEMEQAFLKLSDNNSKSFHLIIIPGRYNSMTKEARELQLDESNHYRKRKSVAVVLTSLSQRLLAKSFFTFKKSDYPIRFFQTEEEAVIWTKELKQNESDN